MCHREAYLYLFYVTISYCQALLMLDLPWYSIVYLKTYKNDGNRWVKTTDISVDASASPAEKALELGETPVGAVIVKDDTIIGRGATGSRRLTIRQPTLRSSPSGPQRKRQVMSV